MPTIHPAPQHLALVITIGVPEADPHEEAIQLRFGQRIGAFVLHRVRGGQHVEGSLEWKGLALYSDLTFVHRFQQRGAAASRSGLE